MKYCIGVDVSKEYLDVDWLGKAWRRKNQAKEIDSIIAKLSNLILDEMLELVICEASGGYEKEFVKRCHKEGIPVHVAHANKIRAFAKSQGILAKTDKLDALVLSDYGRLMKPKADSILLSENAEKIRGLLLRRNQLLKQKLMEQNRLEINKDEVVINSLTRHISWLVSEIETVEIELAKLQFADDILTQHKLLTSIRGIGDIAANYLTAFLPELGKLESVKSFV